MRESEDKGAKQGRGRNVVSEMLRSIKNNGRNAEEMEKITEGNSSYNEKQGIGNDGNCEKERENKPEHFVPRP